MERKRIIKNGHIVVKNPLYQELPKREVISLSLPQTRGASAQKDLNFTLKRKKKPAQPGKREGKSNRFISKFSQISPKKINSCLWDGFCYERLNYIM